MSWLEIAGFLALGFVAGGYGALVGIGGGLLVVPVLVFLHYPARIAAGTSMVVVLGTALSGSIAYLRRGTVHLRAALIFAIAGLPGALLGALIDQRLPQQLFSGLFALLLVIAAIRGFSAPPDGTTKSDDPHAGGVRAKFSIAAAIGVGFFAGFVASVLGVGGGLIFVPTMVYFFGFAAHVATATSTAAIALTAISGTASHAYYHDIRWGPAIAIACGAVAGAQVGARIAPSVRSHHLMRLFSLGLLGAAAWLAYRALHPIAL